MKRKLRPCIQKTLEITLFILIGFTACITDFNFQAIPMIAIAMLSILVIGYILVKYGKYKQE